MKSDVTLRRILALGLLVLSLGLLGIGIVWPTSAYVLDRYREQNRLVERIARARARAAELPVVRKAVESAVAQPLWQSAYGDARGQSTAAQVEADVRAALSPLGAGAAVERLQAVTSRELVELGERIKLSISADQLADAIERLERAPRLLRVRSLKVASPLVQHDDRNELLDVTLEVVGYGVAPIESSRR
jgi:hypothetical protein